MCCVCPGRPSDQMETILMFWVVAYTGTMPAYGGEGGIISQTRSPGDNFPKYVPQAEARAQIKFNWAEIRNKC